jgi:hypothetical protein
MSYGPLTLARRHLLGDLYSRCDRSSTVPVYLNDTEGEMLGYADEGLGHYADAITFHLSEENCKKLAGGQFVYSFAYEFVEKARPGLSDSRRRVKLTSILLTARKSYEKPQPKNLVNSEAVESV